MPNDLEVVERVAARRRSVRAFLPEPVDRSIIERAIRIAGTAPSSCNTQPWMIRVVSGETLKRLGSELTAAALAGQPRTPEVEQAQPYRGLYRERQIAAAVSLFAAQGVARADLEKRKESFLRNYRFFGAPHAAFLFMPKDGGLREAADCGNFAQTFMLALTAAGVGSCPQGSLADYPQIVRGVLGLEDDSSLLIGLSFGYADYSNPSAEVSTRKATLEELATFH